MRPHLSQSRQRSLARLICLCLALSMAAACGRTDTISKDGPPVETPATIDPNNPPVITASPNPVPAGGAGKTTISWSAPGFDGPEVRVAKDGEAERLFSRKGTSGEEEAGFIDAGAIYEFRLYPSDRPSKPLATVKVTRAE